MCSSDLFWVIPVTCTVQQPIDVPNLLLERDAIWSAAVAAYKAGEGNELGVAHQEAVEAENTNYLVESPWKAPIEKWLAAPVNHGKHITSEVLLCEAILKPVERQTRSDQMQIASIMRELGFQKKRQTIDGAQKWVFCQPR